MRSPSVTVVTPWVDHRELERGYWDAVLYEDSQVLVIDNGSEPRLPNAWRLDWNSGFSYASNLGLQIARTDAVLFLNNDVAVTKRGWLEPIRDALEPGVLVGPVIRDDEHGQVDGQPLPYLDGWCLAGMREDLLELGGFDEGYEEPSYYSDNDLSFRARLAGMTLREARCGIAHLASRTSGGVQGPGVLDVFGRNRERFRRLVTETLVAV